METCGKINCRGKELECNEPIVMGMLSATPDFFEKSRMLSAQIAIDKVEEMLNHGAGIIWHRWPKYKAGQ